MPMYVKKGDKVLEIPREVRAQSPEEVEAFVKDGGKAYHQKKAAEAKEAEAEAAKAAKAAEAKAEEAKKKEGANK